MSVKSLEDEERVDIREFLSKLSKSLDEDLSELNDFQLRPASERLRRRFCGGDSSRAGDLQLAEELKYLNTNFLFERYLSPDSITSHRGGILGKFYIRLKRFFISKLRNLFLSAYLDAERQFVENLVRHLNNTGRYIDARYSELDARITHEVARLDEEISGVEVGLRAKNGVRRGS